MVRRLASLAMLLMVVCPIAAGLIGTVLPAFGYFPAIGQHSVSLDAWRDLLDTPGIATTIRITLVSGLGAAALSLGFAMGFSFLVAFQRAPRWLSGLLSPVLASPHAAMAVGFAFLIAPSGWLARAISPELTGWTSPPQIVTVRDPAGFALMFSLVLKEAPFLALMMSGAMGQIRWRESLKAATALGYSPSKAWLVTVFPLIYRQIRLPIYAVLTFSLSVVDLAIILAPGSPPPLAVQVARWFLDYDVALYPKAAAAAVLQLTLCLSAILLWRFGERVGKNIWCFWVAGGSRRSMLDPIAPIMGRLFAIGLILAISSLLGIFFWSVATEWRFPDALPAGLTLAMWHHAIPELEMPTWNTVVIAGLSTTFALLLVILVLEWEIKAGRPSRSMTIVMAPLLIPQIAFMFGLQVGFVHLGIDGTLLTVIGVHIIFVLPYLILSLADPYRSLDPRYVRAAQAMGTGAIKTFLRVKLPLLLRPILLAWAVGFAVSVAQYLPTLFAGTGRITTLTTEMVTLTSGADRRILGVYATLLSLLPALMYLAAAATPAILFRNRQAMR